MECPKCGTLNPLINNYCRECGSRLERQGQQPSLGPTPSRAGRQEGDLSPPQVPPFLSQASSLEEAFWGESPPGPKRRGRISSLLSGALETVANNRALATGIAAGVAGIVAIVLLVVLLASPAPKEEHASSRGVDYIALARSRMQAGDYTSASQLLQTALQQNPQDATALALLDEARRQSASQPAPAVAAPAAQATPDPALAATLERMFEGVPASGSVASSPPSPGAPKSVPRTGYSGGTLRQGTPVGGNASELVEAAIPPPLVNGYSLRTNSWAAEEPAGEAEGTIPRMGGAARPWLYLNNPPPRPIGVVPLLPAGGSSASATLQPMAPAVSSLPAWMVNPYTPRSSLQPVPFPGVKPPAATEAPPAGTTTPALTVRPATNFLGQARAHQTTAQQLRRENRLEASRKEYQAAINACHAALENGELKQEAESILSTCEAGLRSLQF